MFNTDLRQSFLTRNTYPQNLITEQVVTWSLHTLHSRLRHTQRQNKINDRRNISEYLSTTPNAPNISPDASKFISYNPKHLMNHPLPLLLLQKTPNNQLNILQLLIRTLHIIIIFLLRIPVIVFFPLVDFVGYFPEGGWACGAVLVVVPVLLVRGLE